MKSILVAFVIVCKVHVAMFHHHRPQTPPMHMCSVLRWCNTSDNDGRDSAVRDLPKVTKWIVDVVIFCHCGGRDETHYVSFPSMSKVMSKLLSSSQAPPRRTTMHTRHRCSVSQNLQMV